MIIGLLITNGGPHSPEKWGGITAARVIDIAAESQDPRLSEARSFETVVATIMTQAHAEVQAAEREGLVEEGSERLLKPIDVEGVIQGAVQDVMDASRSTSFAAHFAKPETKEYLINAFRADLHHNAYIERSWHANDHRDRGPDAPRGAKEFDHPACVAFRAVEREGHALLTRPQSDDPQRLSELSEHGGRELVLKMVANAVPNAHLRDRAA